MSDYHGLGKPLPGTELYRPWKADEPITVTTRPDGQLEVNGFPAVVAFSTPFLEKTDYDVFEINITVRAMNGEATYRVVEGQSGVLYAIRRPPKRPS